MPLKQLSPALFLFLFYFGNGIGFAQEETKETDSLTVAKVELQKKAIQIIILSSNIIEYLHWVPVGWG